VNAVCPGMVRTEMLVNDKSLSESQLEIYEKQRYPLGFGRPEDVAPAIAFLLGDGSTWITGSNIVLDGGASAK
jgi:NAD(P)-dependent dehydrogenase (short-subunit alcohol dehydrogenase family)